MLSHDQIVQLFIYLKLPFDEQGMCFGIVAMALQAHLAGDMETYIKRLKLLSRYKDDPGSFVMTLEQAKKYQQTNDKFARHHVQQMWKHHVNKLSEIKAVEEFLTIEQKQVYYRDLSEEQTRLRKKLPAHIGMADWC